jgi:hypothetical protein
MYRDSARGKTLVLQNVRTNCVEDARQGIHAILYHSALR